MSHSIGLDFLVTGLVLAFVLTPAVPLLATDLQLSRTEPSLEQTASPAADRSETSPDSVQRASPKIEGAVIRAYRQATVAAEVQGVVEKRYGKEGDLARAGSVVFEISPDLFQTIADRSRERLEERRAIRERYEEELKLKERLLSHDAGTLQEIVKARSEVKVATHREKEASLDLQLAIRDMNKCKVRAPFTGWLVSLHRDAFESVQRFEQLFLISDTSKVYAVANVPQALARQATKGANASFYSSSGAVFHGTVDKVEAVIDPASQTRKVYILIDNSKASLQMGMLGQITFALADRQDR
ncbi:MAG: efflux RND transporter periplasmic adaptor subunit [Desulfomonile tiedjei]|nr:efflux RND transporter periplasmic adaptor subunit [Desulfomonile tiedjei]